MEQTTTNTTTNQAEVYQSRFVKLAEDSWREDETFKTVIPLEFTNAMLEQIAARQKEGRLYIVRALDRSFAELLQECEDEDGGDDWDDRQTIKAIMALFAFRDALVLANECCCEAIRRFKAVDIALHPTTATNLQPTEDEAAA